MSDSPTPDAGTQSIQPTPSQGPSDGGKSSLDSKTMSDLQAQIKTLETEAFKNRSPMEKLTDHIIHSYDMYLAADTISPVNTPP